MNKPRRKSIRRWSATASGSLPRRRKLSLEWLEDRRLLAPAAGALTACGGVSGSFESPLSILSTVPTPRTAIAAGPGSDVVSPEGVAPVVLRDELIPGWTVLRREDPAIPVSLSRVLPGGVVAAAAPIDAYATVDAGAFVLEDEVLPGWVMLREQTAAIPRQLDRSAPPAPASASSEGAPEALAGPPPTIDLKKGPGLVANPAASAAFDEAAAILSALLDDPITVVVDADLADLGTGVLGQASTVVFRDGYDAIRDLMVADADPSTEAIVAALPTWAQFDSILPAGFSLTGDLAASRANLLALGVDPSELSGGPNSQYDPSVKRDMSITFNSSYGWDYDRSDGIATAAYDFAAVALHEIVHGLGFVSVVDTIDATMATPGAVSPTLLDLFRIGPGTATDFTGTPRILAPGSIVSDQVIHDGGVHDFTGVVPTMAGIVVGDVPMATGRYNGDGRQASHFKDNDAFTNKINIGIMDPVMFGSGVQVEVQSPDLRALGLIGWDVADPPGTTILKADFTGGLPAGWTIDDGFSDGKTWDATNAGNVRNPLSGAFMVVDSDRAGFTDMDESLVTPSMDLSGHQATTLDFTHYFHHFSTEMADVDVRVDGGAWQNVGRFQSADASGNVSIDLSSIADGRSDVQVRFRYHDAHYEWYWQIDNVRVSAEPRAPGPDIHVRGNGLDILDGDATPSLSDGTDFGPVAVTGGEVTHTFTIENTGDIVLHLAGSDPVSIEGLHATEFTVVAQPASLAIEPSQSTTFDVRFDPAADGVRTASVRIASDDPDENPYVFAVQGTGVFTGEIRGRAWNDLDGNGTWDAGEPAAPDWTIYLDANANGQWDAGEPKVVTGGDGAYALTQVGTGTHRVAEVPRTGWTQTYPPPPGTHTVSLTDGQAVVDRDFGNRQDPIQTTAIVASVDGYANDADLDGTFDTLNTTGTSIVTRWFSSTGEDRGLLEFNISGISPAVTVVSASLQFRVNSYTTPPDPELDVYGYVADGAISLADALTPASKIGTATITDLGMNSVSLDPSFFQSLLGSADYVGLRTQIPVLAGSWASFYSVDATYLPDADHPTLILETTAGPSGEIRGVKWDDRNGNGVRDAGEPGLVGWEIYLDLNTNGQWDAGEPKTTTGTGGLYAFTELSAGTYAVAEVPQPSWTQTFPAAPGTHGVVLVDGQVAVDVDFGNQALPGEIRGAKWDDVDGDGIWDAGEPGLPDWEIYLDLNANGAWDAGEPRTTTDATGAYAFPGLAPGIYLVGEVSQAGWEQTFPTSPDTAVGFLSIDDPPEGDAPRAVAFTPDGEHVLVVNRDTNNVTVLDAATRTVVATVPVGDHPTDVAVGAGYALVTNRDSDDVTVIHLGTWTVAQTVPITGTEPYRVAVTADRAKAVVGVINAPFDASSPVPSAFSVIDLSTLSELRTFPTSPQGVISLWSSPETRDYGYAYSQFAVAPDGRTIVLPYRAGAKIMVYDLTTGAEVAALDSELRPTAVDISADGALAVVSHETAYQATTNDVSVVDLSAPTPFIADTFDTGSDLDNRVIRITPDKAYAVVTTYNDVLFVDLASGATASSFYAATINDLQISHDGNYLFVAGYEPEVVDLATRAVVKRFFGTFAFEAAVSPVDDRAVALNSHAAEDVGFFNIQGASGFVEGIVPSGSPPEGDAPRYLALSLDGKTAVTGNTISKNVSIIDLATRTVRAHVDAGERVQGVAITPDGKTALAANMESHTVSVIDVSAGTLLATLSVPERPSEIAVSPDNRWAYVTSVAGTDRVYFIELDGASSRVDGSLAVGNYGGYSTYDFGMSNGIALSPDGSVLAACSGFTDEVILIDTAARSVIKAVSTGAGSDPIQAAFSPDGTRLYVLNYGNDTVSVVSVDGAASSVVATIAGMDTPATVHVDAAGAFVYVGNHGWDRPGVEVIDAATNTVVKSIALSNGGAPRSAYLSADDAVLYLAGHRSDGMASVYRVDAQGADSALIDETPLDGAAMILGFSESLKTAVVSMPLADGVAVLDFSIRLPGAHTVNVGPAEIVEEVDFGNRRTATAEIRGTKFDDWNGDRIWDIDEPGLPGVTIFLDQNGNGVLDAGEPSTVTAHDDPATTDVNEAGTYAFTGLAAGTYTVAEVVPDGFEQTYPTSGTQQITLASGQVLEHLNFGNHDVAAPTADLVDVTPDPRFEPVEQITIVFSEIVTGVDFTDFSLTRDGVALTLTAANDPVTSDGGVTWVMPGLASLTDVAGRYVLTLVASGSGIRDRSNNLLAVDASDAWELQSLFDYGDAPAPYPTLLPTGARHAAVGPALGAHRDTEADGQPTAGADGDDANGTPDDEDGVIFASATLYVSTTADGRATVDVDLQNADAASNRLDAWIDFNRDGDWDDPGEQIFADFDLGTANGVRTLVFTIPRDTGANVQYGDTYTRFRLSTAGGLSPAGSAPDGEVEDYRITLAPMVQIVDDGDPGFHAATGAGNAGWTRHAGPNLGFQNDCSLSYRKPSGAEPDVAAWSFDVTPGTYQVAANWLPFINRAPDAPYRILDGSTVLATIEVDQRVGPDDFSDPVDGGTWKILGEFEVTGDRLVVELSDATDFWSYVCADGVRIERVLVAVHESGGTTEVAEESETADTYQLVLSQIPAADVDITLTHDRQIALDKTSLTFTPANWNIPQTVTVTAVNDAVVEDSVHAAAIRHTVASADALFDGAAIRDVTVRVADNDVKVIDNGDPEFAKVGDWTDYQGPSQGYGGDGSLSFAGDGSDVASWTFAVEPGTYQVAATWLPGVNRADNAPYRVYDGATELATVRVDQRAIPDDFADPDYGGTWQRLGEFTVTGDVLVVTLADDVGPGWKYVCADAVRVERVLVPVIESDRSTEVHEEGATSDAYQIVLAQAPTADVVIAIAGNGQVTLDKTSLTFTPANWNIPQTVTVTAVNDALVEASVHAATIRHTVASADAIFHGAAIRDVTVRVADDDVKVIDNGDARWLHTTAQLAYPRSGLAAAVVGTKVIFVGGAETTEGQQQAEVFDMATGAWSLMTLPRTPGACVAASVGSKAYFADSLGFVHIYDDQTGQWTTTNLSKARYWFASASAGGYVLFAGGWNNYDIDIVDVYDTATGTWSVEQLSDARYGLAGTGVGPYAIFAGGDDFSGPWRDTVDIYDTRTREWTTAALSGRATDPAAVSLGGKAYIAGGYGDGGFRTAVDIYDPAAGTWSSANLAQGRDSIAAAANDRFALFAGGWRRIGTDEYEASDVVDIFDSLTGEWRTDRLIVGRYNAAAASLGNMILVAGGSMLGPTSLDSVEIFTLLDSFAATGDWTDDTGPGIGYGDDSSLSFAGDGSHVASWTFAVEPGTYQVAATWVPGVNRADNAPYRVYDGATELATVRVDQRAIPDDFADPDYGGTWQRLGEFTVTGDVLVVTLADDVGAGWKYVCADAVRVERVLVPVIESDRSTEVHEEGATSDAYQIVLAQAPTADVVIAIAGNDQVTLDKTSLTFTPADWNIPQTVTVTAVNDALVEASVHTATIRHTATSADPVFHGATVRELVVRVVDNDVKLIDNVIDNGDPEFTKVGDWTDYQGPGQGYDDDCSLSFAGDGSSVARWTFAVEPGTYQVSATWLPFVNRADNAPYRVYDGSTELATIRVDQRAAPDDVIDPDYGGTWKILGTFEATGDTLVVTLANDVGWGWKYVCADAIRIQRILIPIIESDRSTEVREEGPTSDSYQIVLAQAPTADVVITISGNDQVTLDKTSLTFTPADWNIPQTVTVTAVDDALVEASVHTATIRHTATSADPVFHGTTVRDLVVHVVDNDVKVIDNGDPDFAKFGDWTDHQGASQGFDDDCSLSFAGDGSSVASWTFAVEPGVYQVSATWLPYVNRADNAPYRIYDGSTELATVRVDQRQSPDDFADADYGGTWEILGAFEVTGGTLVVTLSNDVGWGWKCVVADAIRIERAGDVAEGTAGFSAAVLVEGARNDRGDASATTRLVHEAAFESLLEADLPPSTGDEVEAVADLILVQSAGAADRGRDEVPAIDCVVEALGDWPMPLGV